MKVKDNCDISFSDLAGAVHIHIDFEGYTSSYRSLFLGLKQCIGDYLKEFDEKF